MLTQHPPSRLDLKYVAGLIDGRGIVRLKRVSAAGSGNGIQQPWITVELTSQETIKALQSTFEVGSVAEIKDPPCKIRKKISLPRYRWTTVSAHAYLVAREILPLSVVKRTALEMIVDFYENHREIKRRGNGSLLQQDRGMGGVR